MKSARPEGQAPAPLACPKCETAVKALPDGSFYCRACKLPVDMPVSSPQCEGSGPQARGLSFLAAPVLVELSCVQREEVHWLWQDRMPLGRLTGIVGDPGVGKSWLTLAIGAAVTTGAPLAEQGAGREPGNVLLLTAEDGLADTVRPRLEDMGADLDRVTVLRAVRDAKGNERHPSLLTDLSALESALAAGGYQLVIIDPINAYLGVDLDTHRDAPLRAVLAPLAALAERLAVAVVFVMHLNKGQRDRAIYRAQGGIAYVAAARVVHLVGVNPDDERERVFACIKNNLAPLPPARAFEIAEGRFLWRGETSVTPAAILGPYSDDGERNALAEAVDFLRSILADGPMWARQVHGEAHEAGISERTLKRAKAALGVKSEHQGGLGHEGHWQWTLPKSATPPNMVDVAPLDDTGCESFSSGEPGGPLGGDNGLRSTDSPLVRYAVEQFGLPIIGRRPAVRRDGRDP